jgi:hypothetical protein
MAVQVPIANSRVDNVPGAVRQVMAKFASVADGDTWKTGLSVITNLNVQSGANKTVGGTIGTGVNSGTVTINVTSGPDTNMFISAEGY